MACIVSQHVSASATVGRYGHGDIVVPCALSTRFGCRSFRLCGPTIRNKLPQDMRSTDSSALGNSVNVVLRAGYLSVRQEAHLKDIDWRCALQMDLIRGGDCGGDEGDMSPQYSDRGDNMPYVPPPKLTSQCMPFSSLTIFLFNSPAKVAPRMHQNSPFWAQKSKNFPTGGTSCFMFPQNSLVSACHSV